MSAPYILLVAAILLLVVLVLVWMRWRHQGDERHVDAHVEAEEKTEEITQPLPVMIRPRVEDAETGGIRAAARTDPGKVRTTNEDDTLLAELEDAEGKVTTGLFAVADGMGGHEKGEVASRLAIEATIEALQAAPFFAEARHLNGQVADEQVFDVLRTAVNKANRAVYDAKVDQATNMGTTLVLALVLQSKVYIANVGDSRAYLVRDGNIMQLTEDHSLVERMVASGQITEAEARLHPQRNVVTRALGTDPQVEVDLFAEPLQPGDRVLLCSDGLSNMVPDPVIGRIASRESDLDTACRFMVRAANDAGGRDNISIVLVEIMPTEAAA